MSVCNQCVRRQNNMVYLLDFQESTVWTVEFNFVASVNRALPFSVQT